MTKIPVFSRNIKKFDCNPRISQTATKENKKHFPLKLSGLSTFTAFCIFLLEKYVSMTVNSENLKVLI